MTVFDIFSSNFILSWELPGDQYQNGIIIGYTVTTENLETLNVTQTYTTATSIIVANLKPFTTYEATVAAHTGPGRGPFSVSITVQTEEACK